ncbi:MAG: DUF2063 domain-containing protein [Methylophaga sp.]
MSHTADSFQQIQYRFAAHIRNPAQQPVPDQIEDRRMAIYRDLFFNNINGTLQSAFPVIHSLFAEDKWQAMVRDFMVKHHCKTPLFVEIAREFIAYLNDERDSDDDPPFLSELAHYEWVELALSIHEAEFRRTPLEHEDCLPLHYSQSPLAWLLIYQYPVHQIGPDNQPWQPSATPVCLLVMRNENEAIKFIELNPVSARLLELLSQGMSGQEAVQEIIQATQHPQPDIVTQGAKQLIEEWLSRGVLLLQTP